MVKKTRGWPPERRARQAAQMRKVKPWLKTTGPKTAEGKNTVARNALRHGFRSADYEAICALLRVQAAFVKQVLQDNKAESLDFLDRSR